MLVDVLVTSRIPIASTSRFMETSATISPLLEQLACQT